MPTYEYECIEKGHRFEEFQSMTAQPLAACKICGGEVRRLIGSGAGIIFKGAGFYQTDYRSASYRAAEKADNPPAPATEGTKKETQSKSGKGSVKEKESANKSTVSDSTSRGTGPKTGNGT